MTDPIQISQLPVATETSDEDLLILRQDDEDKQITVGDFFSSVLIPANNLSDVANAATSRTNLGVPSIADVLLKANNLSEIPDKAAARANLSVPSLAQVLSPSSNLSDLPDASVARTNLEIPSVSEVLLKANNLSDVPNKPTARSNLGIPAADEVLLKTNNLSDVPNKATARSNLGVSATSDVLLKANNLSDVPNKPTARSNLGVSATSEVLLKANNLSDVASAATAFNNLSPMTTSGDMIYRNSTTNARLPIGSNAKIIQAVSGVPTYVGSSLFGSMVYMTDFSAGGIATLPDFFDYYGDFAKLASGTGLFIVIETIRHSVNGIVTLQFAAGGTYKTSLYMWGGMYGSSSDGSTSASGFALFGGVTNQSGGTSYANGQYYFGHSSNWDNTGNPNMMIVNGSFNAYSSSGPSFVSGTMGGVSQLTPNVSSPTSNWYVSHLKLLTTGTFSEIKAKVFLIRGFLTP